MYNTRFAAAMAQGRRPDPFRTRKLRPGTAMVLHPEGCGRVARRRTQTSQGGDTTSVPPPFSTYPDKRHVDTWRIPHPNARQAHTTQTSHTRQPADAARLGEADTASSARDTAADGNHQPGNQKSTASGSLHAPPMPRSSSITCMSSSVNSKSNTSIFDRIRFICTDFGSGNTSCCNAQRTQT